MAYLDAQHLFSDAQAVTTTAVSTNVIDLGGDHNVGIGEPMAVVVCVDVALDDSDADETYVITLQTGSTATPTTVIATKTATRGDAAGTKYVLGVPADTSGERYLRLNFTHGGTSPSATYTAFLIPQNMIQNYVSYPDGFTIS